MFFYFTQTFLGPHPRPNTAYHVAFNLPSLIAPLFLLAHVVFARGISPASY